MLNPTTKQQGENEWLSLDEYVSAGKSGAILYVRVRGQLMLDTGIEAGDLAVVERNRQPVSTDLVLCESKSAYIIKRFAAGECFAEPLRLAVRNGEAVERQSSLNRVEIVGAVTHVVKNLTG